jgi:hypothetical protein
MKTHQTLKPSVYITIAGINFLVKFENIPQSYLQVKLYTRIKKSFLQFIRSQKPVRIDYTLTIQSVETKQFFMSNKTHSLVLFKSLIQKNMTLYTIFDHVSIYQFLLLLIDILKDTLVVRDGFVMHASGVTFFKKRAVILFTGPSGIGKSTITTLLKKEFPTFSDDYIAIKREDSKYYCYRIPSLVDNKKYINVPLKVQLTAVCILRQSNEYKFLKYTDQKHLTQLIKLQIISDSIEPRFIRYFLVPFIKQNTFYELKFGLNGGRVKDLFNKLNNLN